MSPDHLRPHELNGLRRAGIVPIPFHSSEPFIAASVRHLDKVLCAELNAAVLSRRQSVTADIAHVGAFEHRVNHDATVASSAARGHPENVGGSFGGAEA